MAIIPPGAEGEGSVLSVRVEEGGDMHTHTRTGQGRVRRELGWSFGVISLQGIRKNQEDQYTAIPDLSVILDTHTQAHSHPQSEVEDTHTYTTISPDGDGDANEDHEQQEQQESNTHPPTHTHTHPDAQAFYAIFDGHCGVRAARYARELTHHYLMEDPAFLTYPAEAMMNVCRRLDREVLEICERESLYCGTTAIMALLRGRKIYVGNLGDCAAILCRGGRSVPLSIAQTPGRPDETARIERANGWVTTEKELFVGQLHRMDLADPTIAQAVEKRVQWVTIYRVCGELSVSRSIGDPDFKGFTAAAAVGADANATLADAGAGEAEGGGGNGGGGGGVSVGSQSDYPFLFPPNHSGLFCADLVIADPEVMEAEVGDEDAFLLLACDGFWDVMDGQEAVDRAMKLLKEGASASEAAAQLGNLALRLGSSDNVTCCLVVFDHGDDQSPPTRPLEMDDYEEEEEEEEGVMR